MCGLSGYVSNRPIGEKHRAQLKHTLSDNILSRGPDNLGLYHSGTSILCHTRLGIQDISSQYSNQPFETRSNVLLFNGEIYNHLDLRKSYLHEHTFQSQSDTETLALLLENYELDYILPKLNGIYAFCIYDKSRNEICLVRDHLGIKPLFYTLVRDNTRSFLCFGSYASTVVNTIRHDCVVGLSPEGLRSFFELGAPYGQYTLFKDIFSVLPAHYIKINLSSWNLSTHQYVFEGSTSDPQDLESILKLELLAGCDTGILLSGGVDSSALAVVLSPEYSIHLDSNEKSFAMEVSKHINSCFQLVKQSSLDPADAYTEYARVTGHCSASAPIPLMTAKALKSTGLRVIFSANGADELFYGYPRTPIPANSHSKSSYFWGSNRSRNPSLNLEHDVQVRHIFRSFDRLKPKILGTKYDSPPPKLQSDLLSAENCDWNLRNYELMTYVAYDLNPTLDHTFMMNSIEARVPFLNQLTLKYANDNTYQDFISPVYGRKSNLKSILMEKDISNLVWDRPKEGFSLSSKSVLERRKLTKAISKALKPYITVDLNLSTRDGIYLESALHAFYYWKKVWLDSGIVEAPI